MLLTINGESYDVPDEPDRPLLWVLRDELGLTGTKFGCGAGFCGSCTVLLGGRIARACITTISQVQDKAILTIEGLASRSLAGGVQLHPVQQAFLEEQVPQCGWCMPGQMLTASALLEENASPDEEAIRAAMSPVYCRCGAYHRIRKAVARAARLAASPAHEGAEGPS